MEVLNACVYRGLVTNRKQHQNNLFGYNSKKPKNNNKKIIEMEQISLQCTIVNYIERTVYMSI